MEDKGRLTSEIKSVDFPPHDIRDNVYVQINVQEDGEWVGDFWAVFERRRLGGKDKYVADWGTVKSGGNGIYVDDHPNFWPVEEAVKELNNRFELQEFVALNTGPSDI